MENYSAQIKEPFFYILKNQAVKKEITESEREKISQAFNVAAKDLLVLFYKQGYLPTVYSYIKENKVKISDNNYKKLKQEFLKELYKSDLMKSELQEISSAFNTEKITHIFFKGEDIRKYYEDGTDRISSDIDVLVSEKDFKTAKSVLTEKLKCKFVASTDYDASFSTINGVNIELHYKLERFAEDGILTDTALNKKIPVEGYRYALSTETCIAYLTYHAAGHFLTGGAGVKFVLDLYLMNKKADFDKDVLNGILLKTKLDKFYDASVKLGEIWFKNADKTEELTFMEDYLLSGGKYGEITNQVAVGEAQSGGKAKYKLKRIFMPYKELCVLYPSLKKVPVLLPFYEVGRWFRVIFKGNIKNAKTELAVSGKVDENTKEKVKDLIQKLGIDKIK